MAKLYNEPGHGVNTWPPSKGISASGGVPGMAEHDFNAAVADEVNRLLSGKLTTYSAQPSRGKDVPLTTRTRLYNEEYRKDRSAIGMSHHGNANANKATKGFGVFYWGGSAAGKKLAQMILAAYKKEFPGLPIWGNGIFESKRNDWTNFAILRDTAAPFVLIEWDFFTNDESRGRMLTTDYRKRCGKVAASVACEWYGIPFTDFTKPAINPNPSTEVRDYFIKGDKLPGVKLLQGNLNKLGFPLDADGIYGNDTEKAVRAFQLQNGLIVDGIAGKATLSLLEARVAKLNKPVPKPIVKPKEEPKVEKTNEPSAWAKATIDKAKSIGVTDGSRLHDPVTREEAIVLAMRAAGLAPKVK